MKGLVLSDKVALVTGGTSGIGKAIAARFVREGARVAVVGSTNLDKATRTASEITQSPGFAKGFVADIADSLQIDDLLRATTDELGPIDILINAAGVWYETPLGATSAEAVRRMIDVNLVGAISLMNAVAPVMKQRGSGHVVNIASIAAHVPTASYGTYAASKAGLVGLTRAAALELAPFGIQVNAISPGNTETPINEYVRTAPEAEERRVWIRRITASNRLFTPAEEVASTALFLVSGEVKGLFGAIINLDEGRSAGIPTR